MGISLQKKSNCNFSLATSNRSVQQDHNSTQELKRFYYNSSKNGKAKNREDKYASKNNSNAISHNNTTNNNNEVSNKNQTSQNDSNNNTGTNGNNSEKNWECNFSPLSQRCKQTVQGKSTEKKKKKQNEIHFEDLATKILYNLKTESDASKLNISSSQKDQNKKKGYNYNYFQPSFLSARSPCLTDKNQIAQGKNTSQENQVNKILDLVSQTPRNLSNVLKYFKNHNINDLSGNQNLSDIENCLDNSKNGEQNGFYSDNNRIISQLSQKKVYISCLLYTSPSPRDQA
eukprot:TRINITY_DN20383_c0_g1_i1.p1 TRINITY_DN20383_c0_g1~~TRINITY_DN20383_c0_g1_i1.p1  ORF type:complete len:287 (+),score=54.81 TRINITY_DN20383_c0_g1_i1:232-1092(+)